MRKPANNRARQAGLRRASDRKTKGCKPWRPGGPGRMPNWAKEGFSVEPQCKPAGKPMRPEHDPDYEVGACRACGAKLAPAPAATPRAQERPIVVRGAADSLTRSAGGRSKPTREQRQAFHGQSLTPAPPPAEPATSRPNPDPPGPEDVARIPDPIAATIATLELERAELEVAIETLKRVQGRKAARS